MSMGYLRKITKDWRKLAAALLTVAAFIFVAIRITDGVDAYIDKHDNNLLIGFVTDIHAGSGATKEKGSGTITPDHFEKNLKSALNDMEEADYIIALGDNIDKKKNCQKYADQLKKMTSDFDVLWVKGNHDKDACFPLLSQKDYYYKDFKDWRIIIINNSYWYPKSQRRSMGKDKIGMIDQEQLNWIKSSLQTDKKVLIAMHIPMWNDNGKGQPYTLRNDYVDFKKMLEDSGNVKYVLAGHYHDNNWIHEENGIVYYILPSIEQEGSEGYHMMLKLE
jgi:predicted MPP superfamily phosphohydrolase